ncbi:MAG: AraC family transcriptional regulator [Propionibacteriaceae bacterium]|jgi:AraC-like DNA-binding protein|nr:AraC family transcriptional regulator [Propionibacteriaceae bacterium]
MDTNDVQTRRTASDWAAVTGVHAGVFSFIDRALLPEAENSFCASRCPLATDGRCDPQVAHRFGSYEAERWGGQYIFYCPAGLVFVATLTNEQGAPSYGLVTGPLVMGELDDLLDDLDPELPELVAVLKVRTPADVGALARVQEALCRSLSSNAPPIAQTGPAEELGLAGTVEPLEGVAHYPFDVEKRLVEMIRRGDRAGASQLINQLLAVLYLASSGDFSRLRQGATELITLFSRAAIDGGADTASIFGEKRVMDRRLSGFTTLDELSGFLVTVFNRFVGYVFDFSRFQHANMLRRTVSYVRAHYAERISLADVAREVWMSPSYLSTVFSAEMGMSFTAYVQSVRIDKGKEFLISTHKTIAEVAAATGFSDQSYFTKVFTKAVGVSPTQFRRQEVVDHGQGGRN